MIKNLAYKIFYRIRTNTFRVLGAKTVGARALVVHQDQVLLVKHTYQSGWYTIGGIVDKNESTLEAIVRELFEEVGLIPTEEPDLFGVYYSNREKRDDHVAFYIVKNFHMQEIYSPEIAEKKWFPFDGLPMDVTPATQRRIEEFLGKRKKSDRW